ncbi:MAG: CCA tRNA nucleotidyltransferase [Lentisphaeria bacterium]|nr:CCA tRNA nucleotidyltransferase [Lentisphaeria bacterium]
MNIQKEIAPHITGIIARLQDAGYEAYIVGGAVRDLLLERKPKDYDIATSATPAEVRKVFRDRRTLLIGRRFQLVHLFHKEEIIEISTFRRRPTQDQQSFRKSDRPAPEHMIFQDNEFGTAEEDAFRRDFTVNALLYDPVENEYADHTKMGKADLEAKIVRCIGDPMIRFEEDPVRILRALKLAGQYGFSIEKETEDAIGRSLHLITLVSPSRLTLELEKILKNPYSHNILKVFRQYGFLKYFLPYIDKNYETDQCRYFLALLEERNRRVQAGLYRDSISVGMSVFTLPFAEKVYMSNCGKEPCPGSLWENRPDFDDFDSLLHAVLKPQTPTRRSVMAAVKILMMQQRLKGIQNMKEEDIAALPRNKSYSHARELALIQNEVNWKMGEEWLTLLPDPGAIPQAKKSKFHSHARRHRGKKMGMTEKNKDVNTSKQINNNNDGDSAAVTEKN